MVAAVVEGVRLRAGRVPGPRPGYLRRSTARHTGFFCGDDDAASLWRAALEKCWREEYTHSITALPICFTEVIIYDCMEYTFRCLKRFSVVASWSTSFHGRKRPTEKSFSVVVRQQAEGLVMHSSSKSFR